jgi:hypothetical protein
VAFDLATAAPVDETAPRKARFDLSSAQPVEPTVERSIPAQVARGVGRTVRAGVLGVTALPNMVGDALGLRSSEAVRKALTKIGLPEAENADERIAEDVASGMAGAGGMVGLGKGLAGGGNALVKRMGEVLSSAPGQQVIAGGTGPGAASVVREDGGGAGAQLVAGAAGTLLPAGSTALAEGVRRTLRGGEAGRQLVADNVRAFNESGAGVPSVGQASETRLARAMESTLAKSPGSAGRMAATAEAEAAGIGSKVDEMASAMATRTGAEPSGRAIKSGIDSFVKEFKSNAGTMYDKLDRHLPKGTRVDVSNTRTALENLNADIPGAPNVSQLFKNARINGIEGALKADVDGVDGVFASLPAWQRQLLEQMPPVQRTATLNGLIDGKLPYEALKKLRTLVGDELATPSLVSDVPRSKWQALYAALSEDLSGAAKAAGPNAERALRRANRFYASGIKRVDDVLAPIIAKGDPEDIFTAAVSGTKEGATTIRGVLKSIPEDSQKVLAATMLKRLGRATPGQQNDLGEAFSAQTFLTNWNRMAPEAKKALFAPMTPATRNELDQIAAVASNMRDGSKVFANPSGTAPAATANFTAGALAISMLTGNVGTTAAIAGGVVGANLSARLMTSPGFVRWLAKSTRAPVEQLPAQLNTLFQVSMNLPRAERRDVRDFIKAARESAASQRSQTAQ